MVPDTFILSYPGGEGSGMQWLLVALNPPSYTNPFFFRMYHSSVITLA